MANKNLAKLSDVATKGLLDKVQERYIEKYADKVLILVEDQKKLRDALTKVDTYMKRVEEGDLLAVDEYMKKKQKLESEDDATL